MAEVKWTCDLQISFVCLVMSVPFNMVLAFNVALYCNFLGGGGGFQLISFL